MSEPYLTELVAPHEPALVDVAVDAVEVSLAGVLPQDILLAVGEDGLARGILCDHELVVVEHPLEVGVVEACAGIDEGPLAIGFLYEDEELREGVAELLAWQAAARLRRSSAADPGHRDGTAP